MRAVERIRTLHQFGEYLVEPERVTAKRLDDSLHTHLADGRVEQDLVLANDHGFAQVLLDVAIAILKVLLRQPAHLSSPMLCPGKGLRLGCSVDGEGLAHGRHPADEVDVRALDRPQPQVGGELDVVVAEQKGGRAT